MGLGTRRLYLSCIDRSIKRMMRCHEHYQAGDIRAAYDWWQAGDAHRRRANRLAKYANVLQGD